MAEVPRGEIIGVPESNRVLWHSLKRILKVVHYVQPILIEHMMTAPSQRDHAVQTVRVRVRRADRVEPARREGPNDHAFAVDALLRVHPVEQRAPLAVGALWVGQVGGRVASARNLDDDGGDPEAPPAFGPDRELGAVAIEAGEDDDAGRRVRGLSGEEIVDGDVGAFVREGVGVRNENLLDRMLAKAGRQE